MHRTTACRHHSQSRRWRGGDSKREPRMAFETKNAAVRGCRQSGDDEVFPLRDVGDLTGDPMPPFISFEVQRRESERSRRSVPLLTGGTQP